MDKKLTYYTVISFHSYCCLNQCAVYQEESGDTHLLSKLDLAILNQIGKQPIVFNELLYRVKELFNGDCSAYMKVLLLKFEELGLMEVRKK